MFTSYFAKQADFLQKSLAKALKKKNSLARKQEKELSVYEAFYTFLRCHLPKQFNLATGRVRNEKHILNRDCDVLIYKKWCERYLELSGGYVLSENLFAFMSLELSLTNSSIVKHIGLTRALKSLYPTQGENHAEQRLVPMYSVLFSYNSARSLLFVKQSLEKALEQKEVALNQQVDMICILDKGLLVKDWEKNGSYRGIETGRDTLMWFYILLVEYLDRDDFIKSNLRNYVKSAKEYSEC